MPQINTFGSKLKIARAKRHIADLEHLIEAFFSDNPYSIAMENCPNTGRLRIAAAFGRPLPNDAATIIGDVVHNLRSALDLLASDAVRANGGEPNRNTGFPIYKTKTDFDGGRVSKLAGAHDTFVDYICGLKPYKIASERSNGDLVIWSLGQLDNDDKHITLLPTAGVAALNNVFAVHKDGPEHGSMMIGRIAVSGEGYATGGTFGDPGMKLIAKGEPSFFVSLNHKDFFRGEDIRTALKGIEARVTEIVTGAAQLEF